MTVNTPASAAGLFNVSVPLNLNATTNLSVLATDASSNASAANAVDSNGALLAIINDNVWPQVATVSPANGNLDVARDRRSGHDFFSHFQR